MKIFGKVKKSEEDCDKELQDALMFFVKDNSDAISRLLLHKVMTQTGYERFNETDAEELINVVDTKKDGSIDIKGN